MLFPSCVLFVQLVDSLWCHMLWCPTWFSLVCPIWIPSVWLRTTWLLVEITAVIFLCSQFLGVRNPEQVWWELFIFCSVMYEFSDGLRSLNGLTSSAGAFSHMPGDWVGLTQGLSLTGLLIRGHIWYLSVVWASHRMCLGSERGSHKSEALVDANVPRKAACQFAKPA